MKIRCATIQDAEVITTQNIALAKESENLDIPKQMVSAGVKALIADRNKGFYLVAEQNNNIIGQVMITVEWSDWRNKPIWWVQSVYVQKEWRKKKVLTQLFTVLQKQARSNGVAMLRLYVHHNNTSALQAYEKLGWKQEPYKVYHFPL
jgi:GNAT superfamily N-acetyltransferase